MNCQLISVPLSRITRPNGILLCKSNPESPVVQLSPANDHRYVCHSYRVFISRSKEEPARWYVRRQPKFDVLTAETAFDLTQHYRNFNCLEPGAR